MGVFKFHLKFWDFLPRGRRKGSLSRSGPHWDRKAGWLVCLFLTGLASPATRFPAAGHTEIVSPLLCGGNRFGPDCQRTVTTTAGVLGARDLAHGVVEGQAEHLHVEVNGVAGEIAFVLRTFLTS
jgi:hypothetical protein